MSAETQNPDPQQFTNNEATADTVHGHYDPSRPVGETPHTPPPASGSGRTLGIVFAIVIIIAIVMGILARKSKEKNLAHETEVESIATVHVITPKVGGNSLELILPGNAQAFIEAPIYSRTNGYLKKWYYDIGAHVKRGALLAEIETPEVDQQLMQSRAELERMEANANLAGVTSDRWQGLLAKHAVSTQEADQNKSNYIAAQAAVDASKANVRRLEQLQSYERITAPFDGIITARNTDIGSLIDAGSGSSNPRELFHLAAVGKLRVFAAVPEASASMIHDGDTATITQDTNPNEKFIGTISRNANAIDRTARTLNVEVDVDNAEGKLLPGAYVFVHFKAPSQSHHLTVPSNTVLFRSEGLRVATVRDGKVQLVPITIGQDYGSSLEVTSGITLRDQIIVNPADSIATGMEVHVAKQQSEDTK